MRNPACARSLLVVIQLVTLFSTGGTRARAQEPPVLDIRVRAAADAQKLAGAQVVVLGTSVAGTTDRDGFVRLRGVPVGVGVVEVRFLGYAPSADTVELAAGATTSLLVKLIVDPIALESVEAAVRQSNLSQRGFFDRKRSGVGTFLTRDDIDRIRPRYLSDVLRRVGGIQVGGSTNSPPARIRGQQRLSGACPIQYFIDGVLTYGYNIDDMRPEDVDGIEIYRGAASIPTDFKRGTASCGVILLWSRVRED